MKYVKFSAANGFWMVLRIETAESLAVRAICDENNHPHLVVKYEELESFNPGGEWIGWVKEVEA